MLNKIILMGRLTHDPELRRTQNGTAVTGFSLAVERDFKDEDGKRATDFIDIVAWRAAAEFVAKYFTKGRMAVVEGRLQIHDWKDKDGKVLTGEQQLTADITLHGVWTFTKKSSGGGGGGGRKPTVTIPDDVPTGLNGDDHYAYIVGYPNGNVEPNGNITRAEVATIFFRLLTEEVRTANSTQSNSLSDVTRGQWFNHAVSTLSSMGIVKGHNDGTFAPNAPITRAEFAAIAARFDDKNTDTSSKFTDIASHWAKNEIGIAANKGWINGYPDGTFRPNQYITRAEAMTLVNRVLNRLPENSSDLLDSMIKWPDNSDASAWYYLAVQEATNSHAYSDKSKDDKYEKWTTIRDARDWTELEK